MRPLLRRLQRRLPPPREGALVLAYHLVDGGTGGVVDLDRFAFESQLELLTQAGEIVALHEVDPRRSNQIVLTFDDAYQNFYDVIWPMLKDRGLPATLYVPLDYIDGGPAPIRNTDLPPCTWEQLNEMASAGLDIGSHTCSHPDLKTVHPSTLEHELVGSKELLERRTGVPVRSFCYPRALFSRAADSIVRSTYETATVGGGGRYTSTTDPHRISRVSLRRDHSLADLKMMLRSRVWLEEALADGVRQLRR